jgi:PiT family inorganic phosphate transporter
MGLTMVLIVLIIACALAFDFINGFHDTANAIATVVSTRVLTPRVAITMAASLNFIGALCFTKVAETIAKGLVTDASQHMILAAILGAIAWNLITWYFGIPSSSSHALVGGLIGAAWLHGGINSIKWHGVLTKVVFPLVTSPISGFLIGILIMGTIIYFLARANAARTSQTFRMLQVVSSAFMSFTHGSNDAQKSMGIIALAVASYGGHNIAKAPIPLWVKVACAVAMALGTSVGGWRIINTMGQRILRLDPVHGFAAEMSASLVILYATLRGSTVSTTHVISGAIFGVGSVKRLSAVRWQVARTMVIAWVLTIPATAVVAAGIYLGLGVLGIR